MPLSFQSSSGASPADVVLKLAETLKPTVDDMRYAAERQRDRIVKRTGQGLDVNGNAFKGYSPAYKKRKEKSGRDSGVVDLTWSGRMLRALRTARVSASNFVLGIYGSEGVRAAAHNNGEGHMPQRKFLATNEQDVALMTRDLKARALARANRTTLNGS